MLRLNVNSVQLIDIMEEVEDEEEINSVEPDSYSSQSEDANDDCRSKSLGFCLFRNPFAISHETL